MTKFHGEGLTVEEDVMRIIISKSERGSMIYRELCVQPRRMPE